MCEDWANQNRQVAKAVLFSDKPRMTSHYQSVPGLGQITPRIDSYLGLGCAWFGSLGFFTDTLSTRFNIYESERIQLSNQSFTPSWNLKEMLYLFSVWKHENCFWHLLAHNSDSRTLWTPGHICATRSLCSRRLNMISNKRSFLLLLGRNQWTAPAVSNGRLLTLC